MGLTLPQKTQGLRFSDGFIQQQLHDDALGLSSPEVDVVCSEMAADILQCVESLQQAYLGLAVPHTTRTEITDSFLQAGESLGKYALENMSAYKEITETSDFVVALKEVCCISSPIV